MREVNKVVDKCAEEFVKAYNSLDSVKTKEAFANLQAAIVWRVACIEEVSNMKVSNSIH